MAKQGLVYRRAYNRDGPCRSQREVRHETKMPDVRFPINLNIKILSCFPNIYISNSAKRVFQSNTNTDLRLCGPAFSLSADIMSVSFSRNISK